MVSAIGFAAGTLTAFAFLPQILKAWRSRSAGDLSTSMLLAQGTGVLLWIVYGVAMAAWPIIAANTVTLAMTLLLLILKQIYAPADKAPRRSTTHT